MVPLSTVLHKVVHRRSSVLVARPALLRSSILPLPVEAAAAASPGVPRRSMVAGGAGSPPFAEERGNVDVGEHRSDRRRVCHPMDAVVCSPTSLV